MKFAKLQAAGNDFILIAAQDTGIDWANLARSICHRHFGVGADGLILVLSSEVGDLKMRVFNPDGSEAEVCGNGLRCFAKYVIERGLVSKPNLAIETLSGIREVEANISGGKVIQVRVDMGVPRFQAEDIPVIVERQGEGRGEVDIMPILDYPVMVGRKKLAMSFVSMGNPHAVSFLSQPVASFPLAELGPKIETHPMFPQRVNFEIARVLNEHQIEARVWERGAAETLSCGSGACAVAVIARLHGYVGGKVDITLPGGNLIVEWHRAGKVWLTGPVEEVFMGEWLL